MKYEELFDELQKVRYEIKDAYEALSEDAENVENIKIQLELYDDEIDRNAPSPDRNDAWMWKTKHALRSRIRDMHGIELELAWLKQRRKMLEFEMRMALEIEGNLNY